MRRTTTLALLASLSLSAGAFAQGGVEPEAKQVLETLLTTITSAKSIGYHAEVAGVGRMFSMLPATKGDVIAARPEDNAKGWKMRITGRSEGIGVEPTIILAVTDTTKWAWVDDPARQVVERFHGQERGTPVDAANVIRIREIFDAQPLAKQLACQTIKMEPAVDLDGVKCNVVYVDEGKDLFKGRWYVATTDHFPRKVEQIIQGGGLDDKRVWTISQVKLNTEPPAGSFAISTPEGYTYSPAVAPAAPQPTATTSTPNIPIKRERAVGPNVDELAPDFELATPTGEKVKLSGFRGSVVLVDFWGSWNLSSKKSAALIQSLATKFKDKPVKVLGLAVREGSDAGPAKFFTDNHLSYTLLLKGDEAAKMYRVKKYPTLFLVGKEGEVLGVYPGYDDKVIKDIETKVEQTLASTEPKGDAAAPKGEPTRIKAKPDAEPSTDK